MILILAVQQIEGNLLQPLVQGRGLGLHAAVIILAVTGGSSVAGIVGAFLAVPVVAVAAEIARYINEQIDARARSDEEHPSELAPAPAAKTAEDAVLLVAAGPPPGAGSQPVDGEEGTDAGSGATGTGTNGNGANGTGANGTGANGTGANGAIGRSAGSDRPPDHARRLRRTSEPPARRGCSSRGNIAGLHSPRDHGHRHRRSADPVARERAR